GRSAASDSRQPAFARRSDARAVSPMSSRAQRGTGVGGRPPSRSARPHRFLATLGMTSLLFSRGNRFAVLDLVELSIEAARPHQLLMRAPLADLAMVKDENGVGGT